MDSKPSLKGAWSCQLNHLNFVGINHIFGLSEVGVACMLLYGILLVVVIKAWLSIF